MSIKHLKKKQWINVYRPVISIVNQFEFNQSVSSLGLICLIWAPPYDTLYVWASEDGCSRVENHFTILKFQNTWSSTWPLAFSPQNKINTWGFPGGAVVESLPANAGDTGSSPGLGGSHMPRSNWAREPQLLSLRVWSLCSATREAAMVRGPRTAMNSGPHLPQLEKALAQKRRPNTVINKSINKRTWISLKK